MQRLGDPVDAAASSVSSGRRRCSVSIVGRGSGYRLEACRRDAVGRRRSRMRAEQRRGHGMPWPKFASSRMRCSSSSESCSTSNAVAVRMDRADLDRLQQRFDLVAHVAHRADAGHACAALQRVQQALQFRDLAAVRAVATPTRERGFALLEQFGGFLAENRGDVGVELGFGVARLDAIAPSGTHRSCRLLG